MPNTQTKIPFNEDHSHSIPLSLLVMIELDSHMQKYQVHLRDPNNSSKVVIREYRGTKAITFHRHYVEIR